MQPYEAHIPFPLQVKIDLNLAGMGWLHLSEVSINLLRPDTSPEISMRKHSNMSEGFRV
jgi:hypothetical protein